MSTQIEIQSFLAYKTEKVVKTMAKISKQEMIMPPPQEHSVADVTEQPQRYAQRGYCLLGGMI